MQKYQEMAYLHDTSRTVCLFELISGTVIPCGPGKKPISCGDLMNINEWAGLLRKSQEMGRLHDISTTVVSLS